jgi:polyhydroxyalkanoate synthesis repressor PhaR
LTREAASRPVPYLSPPFALQCGAFSGRIAPEHIDQSGSPMTNPLRMIKKYPNRRLYDTMNSGYITLADVKKMILESIEFKVVDAKSNEDLTRTILLQIILEEESGGMPMFSTEMLTQMIRFYGHAMQGVMGSYLERNLQSFLQIQNKLQEQTKNLYGDASSLTPEVWKQFLQMQAPGMQGMIGNYLEQSAKVFMEMQEQMQKQARGMFGAFQFPGFPASGAGNEDK